MGKGIAICGIWIGSALAIYAGADVRIFIATCITTVIVAMCAFEK